MPEPHNNTRDTPVTGQERRKTSAALRDARDIIEGHPDITRIVPWMELF